MRVRVLIDLYVGSADSKDRHRLTSDLEIPQLPTCVEGYRFSLLHGAKTFTYALESITWSEKQQMWVLRMASLSAEAHGGPERVAALSTDQNWKRLDA